MDKLHYEFGVLFRAKTDEELAEQIERYKNPKPFEKAPVKKGPRKR